MERPQLAPRLTSLPVATVHGFEVREAASFRSRLLGLALLDRREAGAGLLIPRCASVHTVGMRFLLDVFFLDQNGVVVAVSRDTSPGRLLINKVAAAVLEIPSAGPASAIRTRRG